MVPLRRHASNRGAYAAFGIAAVIVVAVGGWLSYPRYPDVPTRDGSRAPDHAYAAGGEGCAPDRLRAITSKAKAASESARCTDAEHEEQRNEEAASEARYSSDLAKQAVSVAEYQGWVFWGQALATAAAFIAAVTAAWAAYRAFRAAEGTLTHAQEVAEAELRPYVFPGEVVWHYLNTPGNPDDIMSWRMSTPFRNSGKTPAKRVVINSNDKVFSLDGVPKDFSFPDGDTTYALGSIGPAQSITHRKVMPVAEFEDLYRKEARQFVWVWVEYSGTAKRRYRTECCYEIIVPNDPVVKESYQFMQAVLIDRFNGSDDTCQRDPKT